MAPLRMALSTLQSSSKSAASPRAPCRNGFCWTDRQILHSFNPPILHLTAPPLRFCFAPGKYQFRGSSSSGQSSPLNEIQVLNLRSRLRDESTLVTEFPLLMVRKKINGQNCVWCRRNQRVSSRHRRRRRLRSMATWEPRRRRCLLTLGPLDAQTPWNLVLCPAFLQ